MIGAEHEQDHHRCLLGGALLLMGAAPAASEPQQGDCVEAEAWYSTNGGSTKHYVIGPDHCVAPTPFPTVLKRDQSIGVGSVAVGVGVGVPAP